LVHSGVYTTEPTFVLDFGIILPAYLGCGIAIFKKKAIGYKLTPVLLTFIIIIGLTVIGQSIVQTSIGIVIPVKELVVLVVSFIVLGIIAVVLNIKFMRYIK